MPEAPEAHVIADGLHALLHNHYLENIELLSGKYRSQATVAERVQQLNELLDDPLKRIRFTKARAHGKLIYIEMELLSIQEQPPEKVERSLGFRYIVSHMGMTGCWRREKGKHAHVAIYYRSKPQDGKMESVYFDDARGFGYFGIASSSELKDMLSKLGPDILSPKFSQELMEKGLAQYPRKPIAVALLQQDALAGVGNYLRADILYQAKLNPMTKVQDLTALQKKRLFKAIVEIAQKAYKARGTTISTYRDVNDQMGGYKPIIYGQTQDPKGLKIESFTLEGRTMYWSPEVQKS